MHRVSTGNDDRNCRDAMHRVSTGNDDRNCRDAMHRVSTWNVDGIVETRCIASLRGMIEPVFAPLFWIITDILGNSVMFIQ